MYQSLRFIFTFNILLLFFCINRGLSENNLIECSYAISTKTSTVTSTVYLTSITTPSVTATLLPDSIENPSSTLSVPPLTISTSRKVLNTKPKIFNIAIMIGSLLTGCIINAIGFLMYWWYKKKRGFMVELYLCTVIMAIMMVAMCVEEILFEFTSVIYNTS